MKSKFVFHGYHPIISRLHIFDHTFGPTISGYPADSYAKWALSLALPDAFWEMARSENDLAETIGAIANGKNLSEKQWEVVLLAASIKIPDWAKKRLNTYAKVYRRAWKKIQPAYDEVVGRWNERLLRRPLRIYTSFEPSKGSYGGTAYPGDVFVMGVPVVGKVNINEAMRILIHESIHIMHQRDKALDKTLDKISKRTDLPVQEAFTETMTNLIAWRAGLQNKVFERYYDKRWEKLVRIEDKMRDAVKDWWENGKDLRKRIMKTFEV